MTLTDLTACGLRRTSRTLLGHALVEKYPHIEWTNFHLLKGRFAQQRHLERVVAALFAVCPPLLCSVPLHTTGRRDQSECT
jgi:hypothetical protein